MRTYDDFIRYGQCQAYGQSREEMEKSVKVFPKIIAYAQDKPVGVISYKAEGPGKKFYTERFGFKIVGEEDDAAVTWFWLRLSRKE